MIGDVGIIHIRPEAHGAGEILPHPLVLPDAFLALVDEGGEAVFLDLLLAVQPQKLLHFQFHRQAVGIPTGFPGHHVALHGAVAGDHILDDAGENVADMGLAVGGGRAVVKDVGLPFFPQLHAFLEDMLLLPELQDFLFPLNEIQIGIHFVVDHTPSEK